MLASLFDPIFQRQLEDIANKRNGDYRSASPFPHAVLDGFLPDAIARQAALEFPGIEANVGWRSKRVPTAFKAGARDIANFPPLLQALVFFFNSGPFLRFLESLTGISNLIADPHLDGGGLHRIGRGGYLEIHADFNRLPGLDLDRRLNLLLYLNIDWREEWGGELELWDTDMTRAEHRIAPLLNRCVVFSTTSDSYHGHPIPLACPPDRARQSLAFYYYTNGRPEHEQRPAHSTLYQKRPQAAST